MAFSAGFTPHPKISYAGAAATGVASEAEYLEIGLTDARDPERVHADLDAALPDGLDIVDVVPVGDGGSLADRLEASEWLLRLEGVAPGDAEKAVVSFMHSDAIEVERLTKKGRRRFDARAAVVAMEVLSGLDGEPDRRAVEANGSPCVILRMVVRHATPAVRPDDVLTGLRQVADLAPPSPPLVTRLAQGPLDEATGELADPLDPDREVASPGEIAAAEQGPVHAQAVESVEPGVVSARP